MDDQSIISTVLIIMVPAAILTAIIVWADSVLQKRDHHRELQAPEQR